MPTFEDMAVGNCAPWLKTNCSRKKGGVNVGWGAIRIGVYHKHMQRWLEHFPMDQIHIVDGERLVIDPALEVSRTEKFLGLEPGKLRRCILFQNLGKNQTNFSSKARRFWSGSSKTVPLRSSSQQHSALLGKD